MSIFHSHVSITSGIYITYFCVIFSEKVFCGKLAEPLHILHALYLAEKGGKEIRIVISIVV